MKTAAHSGFRSSSLSWTQWTIGSNCSPLTFVKKSSKTDLKSSHWETFRFSTLRDFGRKKAKKGPFNSRGEIPCILIEDFGGEVGGSWDGRFSRAISMAYMGLNPTPWSRACRPGLCGSAHPKHSIGPPTFAKLNIYTVRHTKYSRKS